MSNQEDKKNPQRGRPPHESESATSKMVMRITRHRKGAYVRAANSETLTEWATRNLDRAAKYDPPPIQYSKVFPD